LEDDPALPEALRLFSNMITRDNFLSFSNFFKETISSSSDRARQKRLRSKDISDYFYNIPYHPRSRMLIDSSSLADPKTFVVKNESQQSPKQSTPVSVFYNAYFPPEAATDDSVKERIVDILREQMKQVGVESALAGRDDVVVRTVTIGAQLDYATIIADACAEHNLDCVHEKHYEQGLEMVTQQHLLEYCQLPENESHIVGYIHNKGSFHPSEAQNGIRRGFTADCLSEQCMNMLETKNSCNVCGRAFKTSWGPLMWATFWSARCDYVKNLVSPLLLQEKNTLAFKERPEQMTTDLFNDDVLEYSLPRNGRYAAEIFVGTHPKLVPCSLALDRQTWWSGNPPYRFRDLIMSHAVPIGDKTYEQYMDKMESDGHVLTDYYLLPGLLWRYHVLYNEMPPAESWIWKHFPDGENWRLAVERIGFPEAFYHRYDNEFVK
jgi:hypothetical protein